MAKKIKSLKGYDIYQDDNGNYIVLANNQKNDMGPFNSVEEAQRAIEFNRNFSAYSNNHDSCEEVFTKGEAKDDDATNELDPQKMMGRKEGSFEDSDPKVAEAQSLINLCGGAM